MLQFFRKYHNFFYSIIAVVIIISFSFFGANSNFSMPTIKDPVAFTAVNGTDVKRSQVEQMAYFLSTSIEDKKAFGTGWGPNFLNSGVIENDFIETGLGSILASQFGEFLAPDLKSRLEREKRYSFYVHPRAPFISVETLWGYFVPETKNALDELRRQKSAVTKSGFDARSKLFLADKKFPAKNLKQVIRHQERQYQWVTPDPDLDYIDLSMFGYHTIEDWFGPRFLRLASQFIINASILAEEQGYVVTDQEALADLQGNSAQSLSYLKSNPNFAGMTPLQYMRQQLAKMNIEETKAINIWKQVMLFERYFKSVGNAVVIDRLPFEQFNQYALEEVEGEMFELPSELRIADFKTMQRFETYLNAVSKNGNRTTLELPKDFRSIQEISKDFPQLIQRRYLVDIASVSLRELQPKVALREMWDWQVSGQGWKILTEKFPQLALGKGNTPDERFEILGELDEATRAKVDETARMAIVRSHPEWIDQQLEKEVLERKPLVIRLKGGLPPLEGVEDRKKLTELLDQAPIWTQSKTISKPLEKFTGDGNTFYRIALIDRSNGWEVAEFGELAKNEVLDEILEPKLQSHYESIRDKYPEKFKKDDGTYRALSEVQEIVSRDYFKSILETIKQNSAPEISSDKEDDVNKLSSRRLYAFVNNIQQSLKKNPRMQERYVRPTDSSSFSVADKLDKRRDVSDQWKLTKKSYQIQRNDEKQTQFKDPLFKLNANEWSSVFVESSGNLWFFQASKKDVSQQDESLIEQMRKAHKGLSDDSQKTLMNKILDKLIEDKAMSVDYLIYRVDEDNEKEKG